MKGLMNLLKATIAMMLAFVISNCSDQGFDTKISDEQEQINDGNNTTEIITTPFHRTVGGPVDRITGDGWIKNYFDKTDEAFQYSIKAPALRDILSNPSCVGISLCYAVDANDQRHIIPVGITGSGKMISSPAVDTENGVISWDTAKKWMANYKGVLRSHFMGATSIGRTVSRPSCKIVWISFAMDDTDKLQLLVSSDNPDKTEFYEDRTTPCPPVCPGED